MENKRIYLTHLAIQNILGQKITPIELAEKIDKNLKSGIFTELIDSEKISLDSMCPISRKMQENPDIIYNTIKIYGNFLTKSQLLEELMAAKNTDKETAEKDLKAVLANKRQFFCVNKKWGISEFALDIDSQNEKDVIYRNYISEDELKSFDKYFEEADFDDENYAEVISGILKKTGIDKIALKTCLYYIWLSDKKLYDCNYILEDIDKSKELVLAGQYLFRKDTLDSYLKEIITLSSDKGQIESETKEETVSAEENTETEEIDITLPDNIIKNLIKTINETDCISLSGLINDYYSDEYYDGLDKNSKESLIEDYLKTALCDPRIEYNGKVWYAKVGFEPEDKEDIINIIKEKETVNSEYIIKDILGVSKKHPKFTDLSKDLEKILSDVNSVSYLGNFTWGLPVEIPEEANVVPDTLYINEILPSENAEGDVFDQEISSDGFEGTLRSDIYNCLCEDVFDEDISKTIYSITPGKQKCVLKYHHKMAGTFPLCQIPPDFFGQKTDAFPVTVFTDNGIKETVYVNNQTRIMVGMAPFYENITDVSGKIFFLEKTENSNEYKFVLGETEKSCAIELNRSLELLAIKSRLETESLTLFDIICEILEKRPIDFIQLVTEINLVKRVSRLMIASVLSSYHCFNHNKKNGKWNLDSKKIDLGFNKTKKKYIKK